MTSGNAAQTIARYSQRCSQDTDRDWSVTYHPKPLRLYSEPTRIKELPMTTYQGYMVTADLENGVLTIKGSNKASRVALAGEDHATDVRLRREDIAGVGFKGASMLTNGTLTVWSVGGKAYKVHFRKKQADGMAQLRDALA